MMGIDLNKSITYHTASFRYFGQNEYHVTRYCNNDVLLLVFDGVLRFTQNGIPCQVSKGEYFIQQHDCYQSADLPSDAPKYLYIHFDAHWSDSPHIPMHGTFDYHLLKSKMEEMNRLAYSDSPYIIKAAKFYEILACLAITEPNDTLAQQIAGFIQQHYNEQLNITMLCDHFSFSKNHIIKVFRDEFSVTPITYLNITRLRKAEQLLITTSISIENISLNCGYTNYSHFYRQFVRRNGMSPEQFRKCKRLDK